MSLYRSAVDHLAPRPTRRRELGAFGLGNRTTFALVGLTFPLNTVHGSLGPGYRKEDRYFGDHGLFVRDAGSGAELAVEREWAGRLRGTALVRTRAELAGGWVLETLDAAPWTAGLDDPERRSLVRLAVLSAPGGAAAPVRLVSRAANSVSVERGPDGEPGLAERNGSRVLRVGFLASGAGAAGDELALPVDPAALPAAVPVVYAYGQDPPAGPGAAASIDETRAAVRARGVPALLAETAERWRAWQAGLARIDTPDPKVDDLFEGMTVTLKVQQSRFGATSPMSLYTRSWLRDIIGPVRFGLDVGNVDDVEAALDYFEAAIRTNGDVRNSVALGLDPAGAPPAPDWDSLGPFSGRTAAESPGYQILAYHRLWKTTGELDRVAERWGYLRRCLDGQVLSEGDLLPFSGDETFRVAMAFALGLNPLFVFEDEAFSTNSQLLYVAAAEALAELAGALGKTGQATELRTRADRVRAATEAAYLQPEGHFASMIYRDTGEPETRPYEDVNLKPFWSGYADPDDPVALANLDATVARLARPDGTFRTRLPAPTRFVVDLLGLELDEGMYTGMVPGYGLHELAVTDHPLADAAFDSLDATVLSSGNWGEYMVTDDDTALSFHDATGLQGNYTARYRPWEGGINLDAAFTYLVGAAPDAPAGAVALAPRLPNGWTELAARGLPVGELRYDLDLRERTGRRTYVLSHDGPVTVTFTVAVRAGTRAVTAIDLDGAPVPMDEVPVRRRYGRATFTPPPFPVEPGHPRTLAVTFGP